MAIKIEKVLTKRALSKFIYFPEKLYHQDSLWSPPIWMAERQTFTTRNPVLAHSDYALFLARENDKVVGRILAYVDHTFNDYYNSKIGMFGSFESVRRPEVAGALFAETEHWLIGQGMDAIRGPINPVEECWGFLYNGFERAATFMMPYNPSYYNEYMDGIGYQKVKDLLAFEGDAEKGYQIPERFIHFREKLLARRTNILIRRIDMKHLNRDAEAIWRISNQAFRNNWGWVPYDKDEIKSVIKKFKPIAFPDTIWMVEDNGLPIGFCLGFPDINIILRQIRGRILPFGFITLVRKRKHLQNYRLFGLALLPEYHGLGLDVLLYMSLFEALTPRRVRLEASYILEDNLSMINALKKLGLKLIKTYRVYEKTLSG